MIHNEPSDAVVTAIHEDFKQRLDEVYAVVLPNLCQMPSKYLDN
ncbi:MAG: hypothetical protein R2822_19800 [Spirosomataceae bacterium]